MLTYETMTFPTMLLIAIIVIALIVIIFQWVYLPKVYFETIFHSRWMSVSHHIISLFLLFITLGLAIVNYKTYQKTAEYNVQTIDNYKIRNRPFVKIEPHSIVKKKRVINTNTNELSTPLYPKFKLKNFGQFPAFIERIDIWIKNEPKDLPMPKGSGDMNIENFALFQGEVAIIDKWVFLLGDGYIEKIKKIKNENNQVYFVFKIIYKILGDDSDNKSVTKNPFVYWAKYKCDNPIDNREAVEYYLSILECGTDDIKPNI